jgi:hypothetical protein
MGIKCWNLEFNAHGLKTFIDVVCRNPNLGLMTKARVCIGANQEWSSRITFHALKSVGKCEGMNSHTPKWVPTLGVGVLMDSQIFRGWLQGVKIPCWTPDGF